MGQDASFQALPENCELMLAARQNIEIAEWIPAFNRFAEASILQLDPTEIETYKLAQLVLKERPGLQDRYFEGGRTYDAIVYLLSPQRRNFEFENDTSLIYEATYGEERLHPEAIAAQGHPIGLVTTARVKIIADYLEQITPEMLHEHYHPPTMRASAVYKMHADDGERKFAGIWGNFVGMREVYRAAANHDEAVIAVID